MIYANICASVYYYNLLFVLTLDFDWAKSFIAIYLFLIIVSPAKYLRFPMLRVFSLAMKAFLAF